MIICGVDMMADVVGRVAKNIEQNICSILSILNTGEVEVEEQVSAMLPQRCWEYRRA